VFCDYLTRYPECIALPNIQAKTVARAFTQAIVCRFGCPSKLLTDQGAQFTSQLFRHVCEFLQIEKIFTVAHHQQSDGLAERTIRTLTDIISHFVQQNPTTWDEALPYALLAYRSSFHEGLKETPHFMMFGRDIQLPFHRLFQKDRVYYNTAEDYKQELIQRLQEAFSTAREKLRHTAEKQEEYRSRTAKPRHFQLGDLVFWADPARPTGNKFSPRNKGPYRVIKVLSEVNYELRHIYTGEKRIVHVERLKRAYIREPFPAEEAEVLTQVDEHDSADTSESARGDQPTVAPQYVRQSMDREAHEISSDSSSSDDFVPPKKKTQAQPRARRLRSDGPTSPHPWVMDKPLERQRTVVYERRNTPPGNAANRTPVSENPVPVTPPVLQPDASVGERILSSLERLLAGTLQHHIISQQIPPGT
jgi:hypothetical protein